MYRLAKLFLIGFIAIFNAIPMAAATCITNVADLAHQVYAKRIAEGSFILQNVNVTYTHHKQPIFAITSGNDSMIIHSSATNIFPKSGDILNISGFIRTGGKYAPFIGAHATNISILAHNNYVKATTAQASALLDGKFDCQLVKISGHVRDIILDEIDTNYIFLILIADGQTIYVACSRSSMQLPPFKSLLGAEITATGLCDPFDIGGRRHIGRLLVPSSSEDIVIKQPSAIDPFDAKELLEIDNISPAKVATLGPRRISGTVIALFHQRMLAIQTKSLEIINVSLSGGASLDELSLPSIGEYVEVVGLPTTDLYRLNLTRAQWRKCQSDNEARTSAINKPKAIHSLAEIVEQKTKSIQYNPFAHGWLVRLTGRISDLPRNKDSTFYLNVNDITIPIDATASPSLINNLVVNNVIEVTGVCIMESEIWQSNVLFPQIQGFRIAIDSSSNLRIISRPSWWTPAKLLVIIITLIILLIAILLWNRFLSIIVDRRSRALFKSQIDKVTSDLRIDERTRLAVELHDSISQSLSAISYEISADNIPAAEQILQSCRTELRRCIWDLRNAALDEKDFNVAIRKTLAPIIGNTTLLVEFNVPRNHINDTTAHTILSILRELAYNSIHHGHAKHISISCNYNQSRLEIVIHDDGCGFNVDSHLGPKEGHFGLIGVQDRVSKLGGTLHLQSKPNFGTSITIIINTRTATTNEDNSDITC